MITDVDPDHAISVHTEDGRTCIVYVSPCLDWVQNPYWVVQVCDELIRESPEMVSAAIVMAFRQLAVELKG